MGDLTGRRAFITGSSSGIGAESARRLAAAGAAIILHGRDEAKLAKVEEEFRQSGADVASVLGPLDNIDQARAIAQQALAIGPIDILLNNAGGSVSGGDTGFFQSGPEIWLRCYEANMLSAVTMTHAIAPGMIERGWGRIIQIASGIVDNPIPTIPDYKAAKAALVAFTTSLAVELGGSGVTANVISPGFIANEGLKAWLMSAAPANGWGESWEEIELNAGREVWPALVSRLGRTADIARAVMFLAATDADYVTGAHLRIDGGLALKK